MTARLDPFPLVSVIVPAFNYGRFITETLDSVRAQTLEQWECLVVDDGSTDDTAAIVADAAQRDARIRLIRQTNQGQAAARNTGLRAARGKFIQLLDADDLIEPDKLRLHSRTLERDAGIDIVYGSVRYFASEQPAEWRFSLFGADQPWMPCVSGAGREVARVLLERNIMAINSPLVRRAVFDEVGPFDASLPRADDWDMWLRCALMGKRFAYRDESGTLGLVRAHPQSLTRRDRRLLAACIAIHEKVPTLTQDHELLERNAQILQWLRRVQALAKRLDELIPPEESFVLIDDEKIRSELIGYPAVPFTERDGRYVGPPTDAEHAVAELQRLRAAGAAFLVVGWPGMWHLEHLPRFRDHLGKSYQCILRDDDLLVYDLRQNVTRR